MYMLPLTAITLLMFGGLFVPLTEVLADVKIGTEGIDQINGTKTADTIYGNEDGDNIRALQGNDIIYGEDGSDFLFGNSGGDLLYGGSGDDVLSGDIGGPNRGADKFHCGPGNDEVLDFEPLEGDYQTDCEIIN
jgi:Ca2+-binding RTX toxin-like protein